MKLRTKLFSILIITAMLIFALSVCAMADTDSSVLTDANETVTDTDTGASDAKEPIETKNFFDEIYSEFMKHSEKILGALTLLGSLILAFAYRKGLIPLLKTSLSALLDAVTKIKEKTQENDTIYREFSDVLTERLDSAETTIIKLGEHIDDLTASLDTCRDAVNTSEKLKIIMSAQVDMLYDIFMCSSLPQFQKEAVCERIQQMKEAISGDENE